MKLGLNNKFSKGFWQSKTVKSVIDEQYYQFKGHYNKYPNMYGDDVWEYMLEAERKTKRARQSNYLSGTHMKRKVNMPNT